ncbi:MAG: hypothetical protein O2780_00645 [Proteobacteria bacterium]|jgi:hypothetical protein|nr:hypothetical protein [Pseudomonadota bacterium]MDA1299836.1 hypothetical protein [Pseudomonadota bacterium]
MDKIEVDYRGARVGLSRDADKLRLVINGIVRDEGIVGKVLRLSSPVQTDYEFHEFIEGVITRQADGLLAVLSAGNTELARRTFQ